MRTISRRTTGLRRTAIAAAVLVTVAIAGCGDDDAPDRPPVADAAAVARDFRTATGATLEGSRGGDAPELQVDRDGDAGRRFPTFSLVVPQTDEARDRLVQDDQGRALPRGRDGFYRPTPTTVVKDYGRGVFLRADLYAVSDSTFAALDRVIAAVAAGTPTRVPDAVRPCQAVGIDPARGKEGSCVLDDEPITVADADGELVRGRLKARLVGVAQTSVIPSRGPGYGIYRTKERVVVVVYRITNRSDTAVDTPFEPRLVVDGRRYGDDDDTSPSISLDAYRPRAFPLQPGASAKLGFAVRVPRAVASRVATSGQLELPTDESVVSLDSYGAFGRIRLSGARTVRIDEGQSATG